MEDEERHSSSSEFGTLLRKYRQRAGLSQEALAERARMSINGIGALERGYRRTPQRDTLAMLAEGLALTEEQRRDFEAAAARSAVPRRLGGTSAPVEAWTEPPAPVLPLAASSFVGRESELDEIASLMREHRFVTLTGAGGIGKTQTALQAGIAADDGESEIYFVGLASATSEAAVFGAIAAAVGVRETPNRPLRETLPPYLREKTVLLILDNCEHVVTAAATAADTLLAGCQRLKILATSREPLRAAGERSYLLPPLSDPSSITLFADRARAIDRRFTLSGENEPIVAELCRRLDGIPLAIELAAARVRVLSPKQLAEKLDERFRLLTGGDRAALPRHQTMRALIDWSYDLLGESERRLFRKLAVFAGGFTLATVSAVCADESIDEMDVLDLLASLIDKSLVQADPTGDARFRLLESTRQYAQEKLEACGEYASTRRAHAIAFTELAEQLEASYDTTPDREWFALAEPELENWRATLEWSLDSREDLLLGQRLAGASRQMWVGHATEGRRWVMTALAKVDETTPAAIVARLELAQALFDSALGQAKACAASARRALERYRAIDDPRGVAFAQRYLGRALLFLGDLTDGEPMLRESAATLRSLGARKLVGSVLEDLGLACQQSDDLAQARALYAEAMAIFQASGAERNGANAATNLAELEFRAGDVHRALRLATAALAVDREANFALKVAHDLCNIAAYYVALERYDEARDRAREALALARGKLVDVLVAWILQRLSAIAALRPNPDRARAARLLAYVDARVAALEAVREYTEAREREKVSAALAAALDPIELEQLRSEGRAFNEEQAVAEALLV